MSGMLGIEHLEKDLWEAADQLRANSKLTSSEYVMPVLGIIFLRQANNLFETVHEKLTSDFQERKTPFEPQRADYINAGSLWLPEKSRWSYIMAPDVPHVNLSNVLIEAMEAIEEAFEPLTGVLPKDFGIFERVVLEDLLRIFNREALKKTTGDIFGRIYEYFLMNFALQGAQDNGEFFTPPSLVQTIVNVIEPYAEKDQVTVLDPACGSGGMFVQSSYFIQKMGGQAPKKALFFGQEKTATTIKLAKMNLAVHGLEGDIREANTFYQDEHNLFGKADFVMANPPFNVDVIDAEKIKTDQRLPFGLPGVNKEKKVSNGNYLWISYFWSYLKATGRAGFVMSSQASSAGNQEKEVRRKLVETGDVDVMIAIRSGFFYTRTVPCELWFFNRGKASQLKDKVLMLDARNINRKVTRKIYDFSPEQSANLTAIVWLYRGDAARYLGLVEFDFKNVAEVSAGVNAKVDDFIRRTTMLLADLEKQISIPDFLPMLQEFQEVFSLFQTDYNVLFNDVKVMTVNLNKTLPTTNEEQKQARVNYEPITNRLKEISKQVEVVFKATTRSMDTLEGIDGMDRRSLNKQLKELEEVRKNAVESLKMPAYFMRQISWLQDRFPDAVLVDVPGLVRLVSKDDIEKADWSLTPGRYVGVAPEEVDKDFDFEQALRDIHVELADLNTESIHLAKTIQTNFEELGI